MRTSFVSLTGRMPADVSLRDSKLLCSSFLTISTARYTRCSLERVFDPYSRSYRLPRSKSFLQSQADDRFSDIRIRQGEQGVLNALRNHDEIRFPMSEPAETYA
jgi:hypothetical protein